MNPHDSNGRPASCPSRRDLLAYVEGALPAGAGAAIVEHSSVCRNCRIALEELSNNRDKAAAEVERTRANVAKADNGAEKGAAGDGLVAEDDFPSLQRSQLESARFQPFSLGQYRVVEQLGRGGMGIVYRAVHTRLKKEMAIKLLLFRQGAEARAVARFQREMEAIGRLDHPNIVRATDAGEFEGAHYLVMELIDGLDLFQLVRRWGRLPVADACELIRQAAAGLQSIGDLGFVHRDIKPSNVKLSSKGEVRILDFGLALLCGDFDRSGEMTGSGQAMGTADYMAPEQWESSHTVDIRADIYSLGCTLFTLLAGRPPFSGPGYESGPRKMTAHLNVPFPNIRDLRPEAPVEVASLLQRMGAKSPADRPAEPSEIVRGLAPFCKSADVVALVSSTKPADTLPAQPHVAGPAEGTRRAGSGRTPSEAARSDVVGRQPRRFRRFAIGGAAVLAIAAALPFVPDPFRAKEKNPDAPPPKNNLLAPAVKAMGWQNLLAVEPTPRLWTPGFNSLLDYKPGGERLIVQSTAALIKLGETAAADYRLQIGFRQVRWTGDFGLYFDGRSEEDGFRFQLIDLRRTDPKSEQPFSLVRGTGLIKPPPAPGLRPFLATQSFATVRLHRPLDNSEQLLEIEVRAHRVRSVRFGGDVYRELPGDAPNDPGPTSRELPTELGIACLGSSITISTARILLNQ
jgi:serine/threonine protein kinase